MMKKYSRLAALILALGTVLAGCGNSGDNSVTGTTDKASGDKGAAQTEEKLISEEEAKKIALEHAGISEDGTTFIKTKLEMDDGAQEYEVEFYTQDIEYDYNIDAVSGDIRSYDNELENRTATVPEDGQTAVTIDEAKALALEKVPGADEASIRIKEDRDDDRSVYEGSILYENKEYEFEIDAATGQFNEWDAD